jgi:hypothetical protein
MSPVCSLNRSKAMCSRGIDAVQVLRTLDTLQNNIKYFEDGAVTPALDRAPLPPPGTMLLFQGRERTAQGFHRFLCLGPAEAQRCSGWTTFPPLSLVPQSSKISDRFPARLPRLQPIKQGCYCEPHNGSSPQEIRRINTPNVCPPEREKGCYGENA